jgi:hypothetical protein
MFMQKKFYSIVMMMLVLFSTSAMAAAPTTASNTVGFNSIDGGSLRITWNSGNGQRRIVIARMGQPVTALPSNGTDYLSDDDFGLGQEVAPGQFVIYDGTGSFIDIKSLQPSTSYYFMVFEYNGTNAATEYLMTGAGGTTTTLSAPTSQSTNLVFSQVSGNSMKLTWSAGNGSRRLVIARQGSSVNANPTDLANYSANSTFGFGSEIGTGNFVVHNGSGNTVTLTSLTPNTNYYFAIFDANGSSTPVFLTINPLTGNQSTLPRPSVASSAVSTSTFDGSSLRLTWTSGNGTRRIVVARAGSAVDALPQDGVDYSPGSSSTFSFSTAPEITPGQKVVYDNASSFTDISGLAPGTTYFFKVFEYDGTGASIVYLTATAGSGSGATVSAPATQASALTFSNVTGNAMTLNWVNGNGSKRIVLAKAGSPVDATPADLVNYSSNPGFGNGAQIGTGNYVVYLSTGSTVNVLGLTTNQTYYFAIFEANGSSNPVFLTASPATGNKATSDRPTVAPSAVGFSIIDGNSMRISWTSGNGTRRIVVARENAPVDAVPQDGVDYTPGATTSSPFSSAPEISAGQKVLYDNSGGFTDLSGLTSGNTYYFRVYEYSGTGSGITYLTSAFGSGNQSTVVAPTTQASGISFTSITGNTMIVNWVNGNGSKRIVLARAGAPVNATPADYNNYSSSGSFGNGAQIGSGNFVIYNGSSATTTMSNLSLNTTYYFAVFEANGSSGPVYNINLPATASQATSDRPTIPSSALNFAIVDGTEMRVLWTAGNGQKRIVVARAGQPVDAVPQDGVDYLAGGSASFTTAPEISAGQKVIYDNTGSFTDLSGLQPGQTYYFRVYEYSGTGAGIAYLATNPGSGSQATLSSPTVQASNISFTSVTGNTALVSWTTGNGSNRMVVVRQGSPVNMNPTDLVSYSASTNFGAGGQIGTGNYVIAKTSLTNTTIGNLLPGTTYYFAIFEFNGSNGPLYLAPALTGQVTTVGPPATQATAGIVSIAGNHSLQLNWVNGSGNRRIVLMKSGAAVDAVPANNIHYFGNSFFGSGSEIGTGNFVVYDGIQDFVTVTNLAQGTTYHFAVFEYNDYGVTTTQVLTTTPARGSSSTIILPVTLLDFSGASKPSGVELDWATTDEKNSDYFEIERSANATDFQVIGKVNSKGNGSSRTDYHFTDRSAFSGNNYYRLKQVDLNGKITIYKTIRITHEDGSLVRYMVNPVREKLELELRKQPAAGSQIQLFDMEGKLVKRSVLASIHFTLDISGLKSGLYIVEIVSGSVKETIRIAKQ